MTSRNAVRSASRHTPLGDGKHKYGAPLHLAMGRRRPMQVDRLHMRFSQLSTSLRAWSFA